MKIYTAFILIAVLFILPLSAQSEVTLDQGLVTISENTVLNDAVRILDLTSVKMESRRLINLSSYNGAIGIPINSMPWRKAMDMIALNNNLDIKDQAGFLAFADHSVATVSADSTATIIDVNAKQVRINAIALVADRAFLKSLGIDWSTVFDGKVAINANFGGATAVPSDLFGIGTAADITINGTTIEISMLLKAIESNQKGSVIAKPNIMVTSGKEGFIQVGQDISIKTVDQSGNVSDAFFATGVIMHVTPTVVAVGDTNLIYLKVSIERSSATPGNVSTIINKSKSETELVLYDGEEAVIGGLYDTDTIKYRGGIPFLKDLPWWVLGIRYLTGYDKFEIKERELVIFLKVDIMDNAIERARKASLKASVSKVPKEAGNWGFTDR
jgi:general secretion pathway protein D